MHIEYCAHQWKVYTSVVTINLSWKWCIEIKQKKILLYWKFISIQNRNLLLCFIVSLWDYDAFIYGKKLWITSPGTHHCKKTPLNGN